MITETQTLRYDEQKQTNNDKGLGVIHIYNKKDNAWLGLIKYVKKHESGKPLVKFYPSDVNVNLSATFKNELKEYTTALSKEWQKDGAGFKVKENLNVKMNLEIDKGDGSPIKKVTV